MTEEVRVVDVRGMRCPFPVKTIRSALGELPTGCVIHMLADDLEARQDVPALLKRLNMPPPEIEENDDGLLFVIQNRKLDQVHDAAPDHSKDAPSAGEAGGGADDESEVDGWPAALQEIVDEFADMDTPLDRYELLYEWADRLELLPESEWTEASRVLGCQSEAHVAAGLDDDGRFHLRGASDAQIVQGLISITTVALNGLRPAEVVDFSPDFVKDMGVAGALTPSRANGFLNMFRKVRGIASTLID